MFRFQVNFQVNEAKFRYKFFQWPQVVKILKKCLLSDFSEFHKIKAPTLILWGNQDEIFPPNLGRSINKDISNSTLIFVTGNHDWILFSPNEFIKLLENWLERKNPPLNFLKSNILDYTDVQNI